MSLSVWPGLELASLAAELSHVEFVVTKAPRSHIQLAVLAPSFWPTILVPLVHCVLRKRAQILKPEKFTSNSNPDVTVCWRRGNVRSPRPLVRHAVSQWPCQPASEPGLQPAPLQLRASETVSLCSLSPPLFHSNSSSHPFAPRRCVLKYVPK